MYSKGDGDAAQYEDEDDTTSTLNGDEGQPTEEESNIRIFLRVKPSRKPSGFFSWDEDSNMMKYDIPKDVAAGLINNSRTSYKFRFDSVIGMEAKQDEVFDRVGRPCVESALNGFNSTVFAYGQTGSGKTFTITGGAERYEDRGLIPRALSLIFERMRNNNQEQIVAQTVMVATVSPEKDQTDESVSTCRFAQRVARVKNDARLNEEVDPAVIIRQLKARVASLEEELAILKGDVNEGAELKEYEIDKLRQKCLNFVNDSEPSAHLSMGEFTYTKMKACFDILKSMANAAGAAAASGGGATGLSGGVKLISAGTGGNNQEMEQRVHELEQLVQQRDNEIAIMVNMIRKEHGATIPTELLSRGFAESTNNQDEHHAKPQKKQSAAAKPAADYASTFVVDSATLDDPAKAFEAFKAQYPKNDAIRDNKIALKRKYDAAKALASEVNEARNQIKALTLKIEKLRKQQAIADEGLLDAGSEGVDAEASSAVVAKARAETEAADQKLKDQIDGHKVAYKKGFNELSELKKEIQHIQKMLEMGRIKRQKDFDLWYQRQGKGALLTETLLAQAKPEPNRSSNNNTQSSGKLRDPIKSSSPERPETLPQKAAPWEAESRQYNESKRVSSSQSQRSSVARQSTASTVEENVSGFYEALDILKRRNNPRNCRQQRDGQVGERSSER
ncbi:hypothetical protein PF011_g14422 [Phytophthora fragariae]|uniref:Kinesin motor domain-containing protein n=1 Tax=Phytophthora fragariae TaxID=53985 RepID=A0A6A3K6R8_9STRA|nr:hypothetical protein PF011_g14422 [Phytophthora fragariae]